MWPDNETDRDLLNFKGVADTVAEFILQAGGQPISVGVSGAWGVGKSSMIRLTRAALAMHQPAGEPTTFVFVEFNAWLYQGYDDARAALLDVIASKLEQVAEERQSGIDKAKEFLGRVRWFRLAKLFALPAASLALGLPPLGLPGEIAGLVADVRAGKADGDELAGVGGALAAFSKGFLEPDAGASPPKDIQALRDSFEGTLSAIGVTLVVLIDDLDRCLPETAISTLEAIRLLLFLQNTAFVIAADDAMIKRAVKHHFGGLEDDELVTNYFDKLIQVPIRVPALGTQEVRAYMMMLFIDDSPALDAARKETLREAVAGQLRESWKGKRVDRAFIKTIDDSLPVELIARLDTAERLAPLMTTATQIAGNPRLIKRFLNALSIRMSISRAQGVGVDEAVLAKLLLFERVVDPKLFADLAAKVNTDPDGKPAFLGPWEAAAAGAKKPEVEKGWDTDFIHSWLGLQPGLAGTDLRGALYVGREQAPAITATDRLSSTAAQLLAALLDSPKEAATLKAPLSELTSAEQAVILERLLAVARQESSWGAPAILTACLTLASVYPAAGASIAGFLTERPHSQIAASIVPRIADQDWANDVFAGWKNADDIGQPVKNAIKKQGNNGNVAKQ